jgi:hypothetical protein
VYTHGEAILAQIARFGLPEDKIFARLQTATWQLMGGCKFFSSQAYRHICPAQDSPET